MKHYQSSQQQAYVIYSNICIFVPNRSQFPFLEQCLLQLALNVSFSHLVADISRLFNSLNKNLTPSTSRKTIKARVPRQPIRVTSAIRYFMSASIPPEHSADFKKYPIVSPISRENICFCAHAGGDDGNSIVTSLMTLYYKPDSVCILYVFINVFPKNYRSVQF